MSMEEGSEMMMYLASGKKKHKRTFWLQGKTLSWDKRKGSSPKKSGEVTRFKPQASIRTAREWFEHMDADNSGAIDEEEVRDLHRQACGKALKQKELRDAMKMMDIDGSGTVEYEEFAIWWKTNGGDLERFSHLGMTVYVTDSRAGVSVTLILIAPDPQTKNMWCSGLHALLAPPPAASPSLVPSGERPKEKWGVEIKIRNCVKSKLGELDLAKDTLTDGKGDDWQELLQWLHGMTMELRSAGDQASPFLKRLLKNTLAVVWDINKNQPGPELKTGSIELLHKTLMKLLTDAVPEPPERLVPPPSVPVRKANVKPQGLRGMSMQEALTRMWELDKPNRCEWGDEGFTLDMQSKGRYERDTCANPLVDWVNKSHKFWSSPVTTAFISLLDNYEREVGRQENITNEEKSEMAKFKREIVKTDVMQFLFNYLRANGKDPRCKQLRRPSDLESLIFNLWLKPYRRVVNNDSSGFEHVFVGEEKDGKIIGLHNWVQYYLEEQKGNIDYLGWVGKQDSDYDDDVNIVTVKFAWQDDDPEVEIKPCSTILFGSTVEFEIAALTMAFLCGNQNGENHLKLGSENINIQCYSKRNRIGGSQVMTAYIELQ